MAHGFKASFVDSDGKDLTGSPAVRELKVEDFFVGGLGAVETMSDDDDLATLQALLHASYLGPNEDGVGVHWTFAA